MDSSTSTLWIGLYPIAGFWLVYIITVLYSVFNANSVNSDQTLHSVAFDPGLYCLPITLLGDF